MILLIPVKESTWILSFIALLLGKLAPTSSPRTSFVIWGGIMTGGRRETCPSTCWSIDEDVLDVGNAEVKCMSSVLESCVSLFEFSSEWCVCPLPPTAGGGS